MLWWKGWPQGSGGGFGLRTHNHTFLHVQTTFSGLGTAQAIWAYFFRHFWASFGLALLRYVPSFVFRAAVFV